EVTPFAEEGLAALADVGDQKGELPAFPGGFVVHVDHVADLVEGEPEPLATQDELESYPVARVEDASSALPLGGEESPVLVEADCPQRGVELLGEFGNAPGSITHQTLLQWKSRHDVYVNVKLC